MAENKKSFIVYTDWKKYIDALNDIQVGQWFRWMFEYCNDKWKDVEIVYPDDVSVKMLCMMTKDTLKRDLKKYEAKLQRIETINQRKRDKVETTSNKKDNDNDNEIVNDIENKVEVCNMLYDKCNMLLSKDNINKNTNVFSAEMTKNVTLTLPTIASPKGNEYPIFEEDIKKWQDVYVGVDVLTELKKMKLWLEANPKSKKTFNGIPRFVNSWLSREQDKASRNMQNKPVAYFEDDNGGFQDL